MNINGHCSRWSVYVILMLINFYLQNIIICIYIGRQLKNQLKIMNIRIKSCIGCHIVRRIILIRLSQN